jgi:hypothetical protein
VPMLQGAVTASSMIGLSCRSTSTTSPSWPSAPPAPL